MNREFIFDASGQKIGFRCRITTSQSGILQLDTGIPCNKFCRTTRGLKLHLRRVHGINFQFDLFEIPKEKKP